MKKPVWDPFSNLHPVNVNWIRVKLAKQDLERFQKRSNLKGMIQSCQLPAVLAYGVSYRASYDGIDTLL